MKHPIPKSNAGFFPLAAPLVAAALLLLGAVVVLVELRAVEYAYARIGVGPRYLFLTLMLTLLGSYVNIPLWRVPGVQGSVGEEVRAFGVRWVVPVLKHKTGTLIAINLGGAVTPILLSLRIIQVTDLFGEIAIATGCVTIVTYLLARPIPGIGIAVPTFVPPVAAAGAALLLSREGAPAVAFVAGTLGTLIGADLLNLGRVQGLGAPIVSIGGAGTFDGIFLTGILAALLA